jgi:hypothetical protein
MKADVVFRNPKPITYKTSTLSKEVELAAKPSVGDSIEYEEGWALACVDYVYILRNSLGVGVRAWFTDEELTDLQAKGWKLR